MNRRDFIKIATAAAVASGARNASSVQDDNLAKSAGSNIVRQLQNRNLILVEMTGGNDGLNTVVPYRNAEYYRNRPTIAIDSDKVLKLDEEFGMHPSMRSLKELWDAGEMTIVQGVGYPEPNRSHFRSIEIWETASNSNELLDRGWLAGIADSIVPKNDSEISAVALAHDDGPFAGSSGRTLIASNIDKFLSLIHI